MKKLILALQKALMVTGLFAGLSFNGNINAQTRTMPSTSANTWTNVPVLLNGLNSATIMYTVGGGTLSPIYGLTYFDGSSGYFDIQDLVLGSLGPTPFSYSTPVGTPDIVIGNTSGGTAHTNYTVAIAYPDLSGLVVEFWDLADDGVNPIGATHTADYTYSGTVTNVHIDLIAEYNNTTPTGLPFSSKFVVTWDDAGSGNVLAACGDLNSGVSSGPVTISSGIMPDVAAIQRTVSAVTHDMALIAYTDASNANLYYREWDITASSVSGATTLDAMAMGDFVTIPRIDALDNFNTNGGSIISNYKVVAQVDSSANSIIRTYDNLTAGTGSPFWTSSNVITLPGGYSGPPYQHYAPTVALGGPKVSVGLPHDGTEYLVQHFTDYSSSTADIVFLEPINYTNPYWLALTSAIDRYYWVCNSTPPTTTSVYANAVSTPVNDATMNSIHIWGQDDGFGGTDIMYKTSPTPHGFKTQHTSTNLASSAWHIFPNPASDFVTIDCPSEKDGAYFQVVDMPGKIVLNGKLQNGSQQVNLATLAPGTYILRLNREDGAGKQQMFVKQ